MMTTSTTSARLVQKLIIVPHRRAVEQFSRWKMIEFTTFLGYFSLRSGSLFVGYGGAVYAILWQMYFTTGIVLTAMRENLSEDQKYINDIILGVCIFGLVVSVASLAFHIVLLVGLYKKRPRIVNVYLYAMITYLVLGSVVVLFSVVSSQGSLLLLTIVLYIYFLLVIRSYRLEIEKSTEPTKEFTKA